MDSYTLSAANLVQNLVVSAPAGVQIRNAAGGTFAASPLTFVPSAGAVNVTIEARIAPTATAGMTFGEISNVSGAASQNVTISGTVLSPPQLGVTPSDVDLGSTTAGTTGLTVDSYAISGSNLLANVVVTPPAGVEIRDAAGGSFTLSALTFVPSAGSISVTIEARIAASATAGQTFGSITNVSGSENASVTVTAFAFGSAQLLSAPTSLNLGTTTAGTAGTTVDTFALSGSNLQANVTVTPPAGVEIRDAAGGTFGSSPLNIVPVAGDINVSIEARIGAGATAGQVFADITCAYQALNADVSVTGTVQAGPMISLVPGALNLGATTEGMPGTGFTYSVSGSNLAADVTVTPPAGTEIRLLPSGLFGTTPLVLAQTGGTLTATDIEVRIAAAAVTGQSFGTISHVAGTTSADLNLSGTVNAPGSGGGGGGGGGEDGGCTSGNQPALTTLLLLTLLSLVLARRQRRTT